MGKVMNVKVDDRSSYEIIFENSYDELYKIFDKFHLSGRKVCIVTDSNVSGYYLEEVKNKVANSVSMVVSYVFNAGEESKNLNTVQGLYEHLVKQHFDRNDVLVALGGGVVGDLTGYAAATYLRGIRFIQMPSSLLAMVDSSIGGKTGVDFLQYKNMVGAFHQPQAVYINLSVLKTLPKEHYFNGFGEIIKYGLCQNEEFYNWLRSNVMEIVNREPSIVSEAVYKSCLYKREIVQRDPNEKGERALLNFGHTIGHAVEKASQFRLLHGQCVGLGMIAALYISMKRGYVDKQDIKQLKELLSKFYMPIHINGISIEEILTGTYNDKKMDAGQIRFILIQKKGKGYIDHTVTDEEIREASRYLMNE